LAWHASVTCTAPQKRRISVSCEIYPHVCSSILQNF
jgi:hypothetical protein